MQIQEVNGVNAAAEQPLPTPRQVKERQPAPASALRFVAAARRQLGDVLRRRDHRMIVVVGPCSIHDPGAAREYARQLKQVAESTSDALLIVMRAYFEKPRTALGWKGLVNDPHLNDTFAVEHGIALARELLLDIAALGLPVATEALDPITARYLQDLVAWSAIGARTSESQTHREMASGLACVVGFKNATHGGLGTAVNALRSAASPHQYLGVNDDGQVALVRTRGNSLAHIVLRGGSGQPNYDSAAIARCEQALADAGLNVNIMVDCAHANAPLRHEQQLDTAQAVAEQIAAGNNSVIGLMLESNLRAGNQPFAPLGELAYGVSVTDPCVGWEETASLLRRLAETLRRPLRRRACSAGCA